MLIMLNVLHFCNIKYIFVTRLINYLITGLSSDLYTGVTQSVTPYSRNLLIHAF